MLYAGPGNGELRLPESDVCLVGSGPAGITIGLRLVDSGLRVLLLESGGLDFDPRIQDLNRGHNVGLRYFPLEAARLRYLGGTTGHWNGKCAPLANEDLQAKPGVRFSGWPLDLPELEPFYAEAQELCQLGSLDLYDPTGLVSRLPPAASFSGTDLQYKLFQRSPPTRFGTVYREPLERARNVHVHLGITVIEIVPNEARSAIDHIRVASDDGRTAEVRARLFILAAGGLENPRLLLASRRLTPAGVGNDHDLVGRFFMEHLYVREAATVATKLPRKALRHFTWSGSSGGAVRVKADFGLSEKRQWELGLPNTRFRLRVGKQIDASTPPEALEPLSDTAPRAARDASLAEDLMRFLAPWRASGLPDKVRLIGLSASMEQFPDPDSRVLLGETKDPHGVPRVELAWRVGEQAYRDLERTLALVGTELTTCGFGVLRSDVTSCEEFLNVVQGEWHHMGTTRMAEDETRGVVDRNCRVFGYANLFIAGSSVFATGGESNPTLTICALAARLADHIRPLLQRRPS